MKWFKRIALGLAALAIAAGCAIALTGWLSLPKVSGAIALNRINGLPAQPISIKRDQHGVPHIEAASVDDAMFAVGFAHAQDRLWQLEMHRRTGSGQLAEILGPPGLETDRFIRTLGVRQAAERQLEKFPADVKAALAAYAAGVNAYIAEGLSVRPAEFWVLGARPGKWEPADSVAWSIMMALDLGGNYNNELFRLNLARHFTTEQIWQLMPQYPGDPVPETADFAGLYRQLGVFKPELKTSDASHDVQQAQALPPQMFLTEPTEGLGSNNWVVAGRRSASGKPLLANDPHLGLTVPAIWYFARIKAPGLDVIGATLPGLPSVVLGRTDRIAWGFTNTGPDVQDLYLEEIDPSDAKRYRTPDGFAQFTERQEIIKVKGAADVTLSVRGTRHGPVVSDVLQGAQDILDTRRFALALRWTALDDDNRTVAAGARLNYAKNAGEAIEALRDYTAPMQNVVIADIDGEIAYVAAGRMPLRKPEHDLKGIAPAPGWDARYDWDGWLAYDKLPRERNPAQGWAATANQRIHAADYQPALTYDWTSPYRQQRIETLLNAQPRHSIDSFRAMQGDVLSLAAKKLTPELSKAAAESKHRLADQARAAIRGFDGLMAADQAAPLIFSAFADQLAQAVFADELGPARARAVYGRRDFRQALEQALADEKTGWCDDITTPVKETCAGRAGAAFDRALDDLARRYGDDPAKWNWGQAHQARSEHRPFGRVPQLAGLFDVSVPTGGDTYTVNVGRLSLYDRARPFTNQHAASLRAIYDLADLDNSRFIYQTGQSGNILSRHYRDMAETWAKADYLPLSVKPKGPLLELRLTGK